MPRAAIYKVRDAAHARNKPVGIFCGDGAYARAMLDKGFDFVIPGTDIGGLVAAASAELAAVREPAYNAATGQGPSGTSACGHPSNSKPRVSY